MTTVPNMLTVLALLPGMAPNPVDEGSLRPGLDPSQVTPGMAGFLMSLVLAVAVILLVLDFNRRSRRLRYRAEYAERRAAEERVGGYAQPSGAAGAAEDARDAGEPGAAEGPEAAGGTGPAGSPGEAGHGAAPPPGGSTGQRG